jgi:hypothetical protein
MIKYTFFFDKDNVCTYVDTEDEDERIFEFIQELKFDCNMLFIEGPKLDLWIFFGSSLVKCVTREKDIEMEQPKVEPAQPQQNLENETN